MTPATRLRLARLRLRWCRVRSCYIRARLQTVTRWRTLCADMRQNPGHRRLLILGLLWLVASVWNWWMTLYVVPSLGGSRAATPRCPLCLRHQPATRLDRCRLAVGHVLGDAPKRCTIRPGSREDVRPLVCLTA